MKINKFMSVIFLSLSLFSGMVNAGIAIVVNTNSAESNISAKQVKRLFLGKKSTFPSGARAIVVDQAVGTSPRDYFYKKVVKKSETQLKAYWSKKIFSGKGAPPPSLANDDEVKAWVNKNSEGIGYIDSASVDNSVKVILSID